MEAKELMEVARRFAAEDPDTKTAQFLSALVESQDEAGLRAAIEPALVFGTAGLRGRVGAGPARINEANIRRVSWALGDYVQAEVGGGSRIFVGFDARPESASLARVCAEVLAALGVRALLAREPVATPCIAYAVRKEGAAAGVVVTASHNPRGDGGFKVFDGDGVQIVAPWDEEIAKRMDAAPEARSIARQADGVEVLPDSLLAAYYSDARAVAEAIVPLEAVERKAIVLPYTPLHGVGLAGARAVLKGLDGSIQLEPVPTQADPDGTFPTIEFPNPEEAAAFESLLAHAEKLGARVACGNDPDADRFALCLPLSGQGLTRLSGDALGLLLADACLRTTKLRNPEVIATIVSSPATGLLAEKYGAHMTRTLTGFKWLCHAALESDEFVFAYEEALGYCFASRSDATTAMDKDGLLALLVTARLLVQQGGGDGLARHLLGIYREIGLWGSFGKSRRYDGPEGEERMLTQMDRLRESPDKRLGGMVVTRRIDYREQAEHRPWYLGAQDLVRFDLEADSEMPGGVTHGRVLVRPSGTEPKLKAYVHLHSDFFDESEYAEKSIAQESVAKAVARQVLRRPESILPPVPSRPPS